MKDSDTNNDMSSATTKVIQKFQTICIAAQEVIDGMKEKERKQVKDIAEKVALTLQMDTKRVLNCVNDFLHETECGYVSRGKHGGFIKGTKPVRIIKSKTVEVQPEVVSTTAINDDDIDDNLSL